MSLQTSDFDYNLPENLIAQAPTERRDNSRLMVLRRAEGVKAKSLSHHVFADLPCLLKGGDVLVVNDTRVIPARFAVSRATGGRIEGLFCREIAPGQWEVMLRGAGRCRDGEKLSLFRGDRCTLTLCKHLERGRWIVRVEPAAAAMEILARAGSAPLPPYIRRDSLADNAEDRQRYQTVYAARPGAVAAPTAGLHFTKHLLDSLSERGIEMLTVTLHVGLGTFAPVLAENPRKHKMHSEWYELTEASAVRLNLARRDGRRIVAVGTTSVRVLETVASGAIAAGLNEREPFSPAAGWTDIFICPPADFHATDALITNFHLPRSTLLMLVAAFYRPGQTAGVPAILDAYARAIEQQYRFYSYGDAMLIE